MALKLNYIKIVKREKNNEISEFYEYIAYPDWFKSKMKPIFEKHRKENNGVLFLAVNPEESSKVVGSIYCELQPKHISYGKQVPIFGWLQGDSEEIIQNLLSEVENYARENGNKILRGPLNMPKTFGWGAQVEGFEYPMLWETSHTPKNLSSWIQSSGYEPETEYITLQLTHLLEADNPFPEIKIVSYPIKELFANKELMGKLKKLVSGSFQGFLPDGATNQNKFVEIGQILAETGHGEDFYIMAINQKTKKIVGFIISVPNIFEIWAGKPLTTVICDTVILDKEYRGVYFFFYLFNKLHKKLIKIGIKNHTSGSIWTKNKPAIATFTKIGKRIGKSVVFQKRLS